VWADQERLLDRAGQRMPVALSLESLTEEERSMAISRDILVTSIAVDV
jgi:hypothetical protein